MNIFGEMPLTAQDLKSKKEVTMAVCPLLSAGRSEFVECLGVRCEWFSVYGAVDSDGCGVDDGFCCVRSAFA